MFKLFVTVAAALIGVTAVSVGIASAVNVDGGIAESEVFGIVAGSESGTQPTPCELATGGPCETALQAAYDRWNTNLPAVLAADLGAFSPGLRLYDEAQTARSALTACMSVDATDPVDGERTWFGTQGVLHPVLLLSESHKLFDASMEVLCPDLDYVRGYEWQGTGEDPGEGDSDNIVKGGLAELPGWQFVDCADALADSCSDPAIQTAFDQWGFKLAMIYSDPETGYPGPELGWFVDNLTDYVTIDRLVLSACNAASLAASVGTSDAEEQWYQETAAAHPDAPANDIRAFFNASLYLVCPDVTYVPAG